MSSAAGVPPLGVTLRADGISAVMLVTTALVIGATALRSRAPTSRHREAATEARAPLVFWTLLLAVVGGDECRLSRPRPVQSLCRARASDLRRGAARMPRRSRRDLSAALRYLAVRARGLCVSICSERRCSTEPTARWTSRCCPKESAPSRPSDRHRIDDGGLLAKTALFPLHLWLPPAHAGAPPQPARSSRRSWSTRSCSRSSASGSTSPPGSPSAAAARVLGTPAPELIIFGSVLALRQARLKLLIAYSTVAQIGYLFPDVSAHGRHRRE